MITQARSSSPTGAALLVAITVLAAAIPSYFNLRTEPPAQQAAQQISQLVTLSEFEQVRTGLSMAQVNLLLGRSGEGINRTQTSNAPKTSLQTWQNPDGSHINVTFQDGLVVAKSQSGLR